MKWGTNIIYNEAFAQGKWGSVNYKWGNLCRRMNMGTVGDESMKIVDTTTSKVLTCSQASSNKDGHYCTTTESCEICLDTISENNVVGHLNRCGHYFHYGCITEWLNLAQTCPKCRTEVQGENNVQMQWLSDLRQNDAKGKGNYTQQHRCMDSTKGLSVKQMYSLVNFAIFNGKLPKLARIIMKKRYHKPSVKPRSGGSVCISLPRCVTQYEQRVKLFDFLSEVFLRNHSYWPDDVWYKYKTFVVE